MWLGCLAWQRLPGSSLPGKRLCCRQLRGFKTLIVYLYPRQPFSPSAPSVGWSGVRGRKRESGSGGRNEEGAKHIRGPGPKYHDQHRLSRQLLPASHSIIQPLSLWQHFGLNRILTLQWGILQIKGDIFGTLPSWHFIALGEGANILIKALSRNGQQRCYFSGFYSKQHS